MRAERVPAGVGDYILPPVLLLSPVRKYFSRFRTLASRLDRKTTISQKSIKKPSV